VSGEETVIHDSALQHAATVILLRTHEGEVQVLLTQRHASLSFMGGMWVFPGGVLAESDGADTALATLPGSPMPWCDRLDTLQGSGSASANVAHWQSPPVAKRSKRPAYCWLARLTERAAMRTSCGCKYSAPPLPSSRVRLLSC
jgi:hypothetical protein